MTPSSAEPAQEASPERGTRVRSSGVVGVLRALLESREALVQALKEADGDLLPAAAGRHGIAGLLLHAINTHQLHVPADALLALRRQASAGAAQGMRVRALLFAALRALHERGIHPVVLKGYGLAVRLYPEPFLRPTTDVDLLVHPDQVGVACRALESLNLAPKNDSDTFYPPAYRHHLAFSGPKGLVELHYRLLANWGGTWDAAEPLSRSQPAALDGVEVRYLCPEDELTYLSLHAANHMLIRLGWLVDLTLFIRAHPLLGWERVIDTARSLSIPRPAFYALDAAHRLAGAPVPEWVLARLAPSRPKTVAARWVFSERHLAEELLDRHRLLRAGAKALLADSWLAMATFAARRWLWNRGFRGDQQDV